MKYKTTKKAIKNGYYRVLGVGYCKMQNLLAYKSEEAYTSGVYGWNFDVYNVDGVAVVTGYRGMFTQNINNDCELIREYDQKAEYIRYNSRTPYEERKEAVNALLIELINKLKEAKEDE